MSTDALLTDADLATRWQKSVRTIKRWRKEGKTPAAVPLGHKGGFGQGVMYRIEDVIAYELAIQNASGNPHNEVKHDSHT